MKQDTCTRP